MTSNGTPIRLDLTLPGDISALSEGQNLQQAAFARVQQLVRTRLEELERSKDPEAARARWIKPYSHGAIAVLGTRGSGKTTFILNALQWLENPNQDEKSQKLQGNVCALGVIDPSVQEHREHGLLKVLALVNEAVERKRRRRSCRDDEHFSNRSDHAYDAVCESLRRMSAGMRFLDGLGRSAPHDTDEWEDSTYLLTKGLSLASAGHLLTEHLNYYLDHVCEYLEVTALVLAFDDVDTHLDHGWPLLEMLRKYLVSPRLIVLVSGSLEQFSLLVRRQQWLQLKDLAQQDERSKRAISSMIDELESQYLLKLLRSERRVELLTLAEAVRRHGELGITVKLPGRRVEEPLYELVLRVVVTAIDPACDLATPTGSIGTTTTQIARRPTLELLTKPVRLIITLLLRAYAETRADPVGAAINPLGQAFSTALMHAGVSLPRLVDPTSDTTVRHAIEYLSVATLRSPTRLLVDSAHDAFEVDLVVVAALVARFRSSPGLGLSYWLRAGGIRSLLTTAPKSASPSDADERRWRELTQLLVNSSQAAMQSTVGLGVLRMSLERGRTSVASTPIWGSVAIIMDRRRTEDPSAAGGKRTIGLADFAPSSTQARKVWGWLYHRMEHKELWPGGPQGEVFSAKGLRQKLTTALNRAQTNNDAAAVASLEARELAVNAVIAVEQQLTGNEYAYVSIWRLLDLLVQIVNGATGADIQNHSHEWVRFPALGLVRSGAAADAYPEWLEDDAVTAEDDSASRGTVYPASALGDDALSYRTWLSQTGDWSTRGILSPPVYVLDRIWDRFEAAIVGIQESARGKSDRYQRLPGWWIYRHIVALWQAVLVEECRYRSILIPRTTSARSSSKDLMSNLNSFRDSQDVTSKCPFFASIFAHPLWSAYLPSFSPLEVQSIDDEPWSLTIRPERELVDRYKKALRAPSNPTYVGYAFDLLNAIIPWGFAGSDTEERSVALNRGRQSRR